MPGPFNDPNLQVLSINDFTSGIVHWSRSGSVSVYPSAPAGSAANAYRCWAKQGIGLLPAPTYVPAQTVSATDATNPVCLSLGNMMTLSARGGRVGDLVCAWLKLTGHGDTAPTNFFVTRWPIDLVNFTPAVLYATSATQVPTNTTFWPMMDYGVFEDPSTHAYARCVLTTDPISTSFTTGNPGIWITVRGWTTPTPTTAPEVSSGTFPLVGLIGSYPRIFYHSPRMGIWQLWSSETATNHFVASDSDELFVSGELVPTGIVDAGTFFAEMGTQVGAWGSWSTGELVGIYSEGGGFLVYGDLFSPSSVYKLGGLMGTAGAAGHAAITPIGMIYPRLGEAVYLWNGDNVCQNISRQLPEGVFTRTPIGGGFSAQGVGATSTQAWGEWVAFPNNWMFDTVTQSWWQLEDPGVLNFQVHCGEHSQTMFSSPAIAYAAAGATATVNVYYWNKNTAVDNYFWQSNPLPVTVGALVSVQNIEIVASNDRATPATITITPTSPTGTIPLANQNQAQPAVFTIPANTSNWRGSQRVGYADYNIQLSVTAANPGQRAPILHAVNVGYTQTRTAGIQ